MFADKLLARGQASFVMHALHGVLNLGSIASMHYEEILTFEVFYNSNVEITVV